MPFSTKDLTTHPRSPILISSMLLNMIFSQALNLMFLMPVMIWFMSFALRSASVSRCLFMFMKRPFSFFCIGTQIKITNGVSRPTQLVTAMIIPV